MTTPILSGTNIRIISGVPFSRDYKHTRWFANETSQSSYFLGKPDLFSNTQFNVQHDSDKKPYISIPPEYETVRNANYLLFQNTQYSNKWYYAFITKIEYVNKQNTHIYFELDVLQTWMFEMNFKQSFVVREHCKLWNTDGTPVINTIDEGLNYGTEYDTVHVENLIAISDISYLVIITKSDVVANDIIPKQIGTPQPLTYYLYPFSLSGEVVRVYDGVTTMELGNPCELLEFVMTNPDFVNNVVSCHITEHIGFNPSYNAIDNVLTFNSGTHQSFINVTSTTGGFRALKVIHMDYFSPQLIMDIDKYASYETVSESKLLMYPYTCLVLDDFKGSRTTLKTEYITENPMTIGIHGSLGTGNKVMYTVENYNHSMGTPSPNAIENAIISNTPNDISIVNDYLSAFLQGNRNQLDNQKNTIAFNGVMGALSSVNVSKGGMTSLDALGGLTSVGNSVLQIQGVQAKINDINNTPPSLVKMGGNTAFDYGNDYKGAYLLKKQIKPEYRKKLEDFFKMFGYKVNEVKIPNLHTRASWNYVQTSSCFIDGNFGNDYREKLKQIFDNGITLWHTDDIGNYSLGNGVI